MLDETHVPRVQQNQTVCDAFRDALHRGASPRIEDFLTGYTGEARQQLLQQLLTMEVEYLQLCGDTLPANDYYLRFSHDRSVLEQVPGLNDQELHDVRQVLDRLSEFGLIPPEDQRILKSELDSGTSDLNTDSLCERLLKLQRLTHFQSQRILRGEIDRLVLGDFLLLDKLGQGGMGVVYRARQLSLNRLVALKTIISRDSAGEAEIYRFRQEAESAARLNHPGIVPVFAFGEASGVHYIAMGLVEGNSLADRIAASTLNSRAAAEVLRQLSDAVAFAHREGVIHRDLKPANILLDREGIPHITDFGLAKFSDREGQTLSGDVLGTPGYMPPEQALGQGAAVREAADIYALGAILYASVCGHAPFKGESVLATLKLVIEQQPVPPSQLNLLIPADLETICLKCLEKEPRLRYSTAEELSRELTRFLNGEPILARPISAPVRFGRWCRRNPMVAGLSAVAVLLLTSGTVISSYFALLAMQRAERAEEGNRIAVETLEAVVFQIQDKLGPIPAAREVRKEILATALKELETLSEGQLRSDRVDAGRAAVLVRFATIIMDVGTDETLGSLEIARRNLEEACRVYERMTAADPANDRLRQGWAFALLKAGDLAVTLNQTREAREFATKAVERYRALSAGEPDRGEWADHLSHALTILGDALDVAGESAAALERYREARTIAESIQQKIPDDTRALDMLITALEKEADTLFRLGDAVSARPLYERNLELNREYLNAAPTDPMRLMSMSMCLERLGDFEASLGQSDAALKYFREELDVTIRAVKEDPKNQNYQRELEAPLKRLISVCRTLGRDAEANAAQKQVTALQQQLRLHESP